MKRVMKGKKKSSRIIYKILLVPVAIMFITGVAQTVFSIISTILAIASHDNHIASEIGFATGSLIATIFLGYVIRIIKRRMV